jgi:hypothetical protein
MTETIETALYRVAKLFRPPSLRSPGQTAKTGPAFGSSQFRLFRPDRVRVYRQFTALIEQAARTGAGDSWQGQIEAEAVIRLPGTGQWRTG